MGRTTYLKEKRPGRLSPSKQEDLVFDLINAFVLADSPKEVALLLRDLLTTKEVRNLAKRLQIAKLLLFGEKYIDIVDQLHCSLGTVAKVKIWLEQGGEGLRRIILRLPKRKTKPGVVGGIPGYRWPQLLLAASQEIVYKREEKDLKDFLEKMEERGILDKNIREQLAEEFRSEKSEKKQRFSS